MVTAATFQKSIRNLGLDICLQQPLLLSFLQYIRRQWNHQHGCVWLILNKFFKVTIVTVIVFSQQSLAENEVDNQDLIAVIHIGPMKTGSSAIQTSLGSVYTELSTIDHYEDAGFSLEKGVETYHIIGCFRPDAVPYTGSPRFEISCHPNALENVTKIATERNHNLIITAEYLTDPKTNLTQFKDFLRPWKRHRIVAYYRRFYDWLISFHNQVMKQKQHIKERQTIVEFLTREYKVHFFWDYTYLQKAIERYEPYFMKDNIHVINTYNQSNHDVRPSFYCEGLIDATAACTKIKKLLLQDTIENDIHHMDYEANPSVPLIYTEMAYYAKVELGLWGDDDTNDDNNNNDDNAKSVEETALRIQQYHEQTLHKKWYEFANETRICPESNVLDWLLETSLNVEKELFPDYYKEHGHDEIVQHFHEILLTKMCHTNVSLIFQRHPEYIDIFDNNHTTKIKNTTTSSSNADERSDVLQRLQKKSNLNNMLLYIDKENNSQIQTATIVTEQP